MANNKGKKYVKLRGGEVATPENEARAREFLEWYGANAEIISNKLIYEHLYDDEIATDTMLNVYDCIAYKGLEVRDYKFYFLRAYHTNYVATKKRKGVPPVSIDTPMYEDGERLGDTIAAPDFDYEAYEETIDTIERTIIEYVRANYSPTECSIFEIYIALYPDISYKKMAKMLGFPVHNIWPVIGTIKKDLVTRFSGWKEFLLSLL